MSQLPPISSKRSLPLPDLDENPSAAPEKRMFGHGRRGRDDQSGESSTISSTPMAAADTENSELLRRRKESANAVLNMILEEDEVSSTVKNYKGHLRRWMAFCDEKCDGDCTVDPQSMLDFFVTVVFKSTVRRHIREEVGYSGAIDVSRVSSEQGEEMEAIGVDDVVDKLAKSTPKELSPWSALIPPPGVDLADWQINLALEDYPSTSASDVQPSQGSELPARKDMDKGKSKAMPIAIGSPSENEQVVQHVPANKDGIRVANVPLAIGSAKNIKKALMYLWNKQTERAAPCPSIATDPRTNAAIREAFRRYENSLVYQTVSTGTTTTRTTSSSTRNPYSEKLYLRMLAYTWRMVPPRRSPHKRIYSQTKRFQYMRERLSLLARHHMLLRDEDLRNLNLANCFNIQTRHIATGSALATGLVFRITRGKTNQKGVELYATAYRHKNFLRCTVAGFAFYMLERFQTEMEPIPNFTEPDQWCNIKVLTAGRSPEERERRRETALSGETQIDATSAVMDACDIDSTRITHSGRHAGRSEAYDRGLSMDDIRHMDRCAMGQMENIYAPKNPTRGAFCLAHFAPDEPYILERDLVTPPLDLQRLVFPWVESNFDEDLPEKKDSWRKECEKEMEGVDPNAATEEDLYWETPARQRAGGLARTLSNESLINRVGFLKLLVRLRRVILQDAALFLKPGSSGRTLKNNLLDALPEIFNAPMFLNFQRSLLDAIAVSQHRTAIISADVTLNSKAVIDAFNTLSQQQSSLSHEIQETTKELKHELQETTKGLRHELQAIRQNQETLIRLIQAQQSAMHQQLHSRPSPNALTLQHWDHMPPQHRDVPRYPRQQQHQQRQPQQQINENGQDDEAAKTRGYVLLPDKGLTIKQAWEEFNGPIVQAKSNDASWPYTDARRRAYRRRQQLFKLIEESAREEGQSVEDAIERLAHTHKNRTISSLLQELIAKKKDNNTT